MLVIPAQVVNETLKQLQSTINEQKKHTAKQEAELQNKVSPPTNPGAP